MADKDIEIEKIDAEKLINDFKVFNCEAFQIYLQGIWKDLASKVEGQDKGIDKITFAKYYELPGIIFDRLFSVFDTEKKNSLNLEVFTQGMMTLFTKSYEDLVKFFFKFYDHDKDGTISKEDIRIVLSYIPLNRNKIMNKGIESKLKERIESQEELHSKLDAVFKSKEQLTEEEFIKAIENINSDIFLYIYVFLQEKRPFNNETIKLLENIKKSPSVLNMPKGQGSKLIASPTLNSVFETSNTINKSPSLNKSPSGGNKVLNVESKIVDNPNQADILLKLAGKMNQPIKPKPKACAPKFKPNVTVKKEEQKLAPMRKVRHLLQDLDSDVKPKKFQGEANNFLFQFARKNDSKKPEPKEAEKEQKEALNKSVSSDEEAHISSHPIFEKAEYEKGNYCGYLLKLSLNNQLKKRWFRLIYKDLYYYESPDVEMHKGMHNLSGVFIKEDPEVLREEKVYYSFSLIGPFKTRTYSVENQNEFKDWLFNLRKAVGYSNLSDLYDIKEEIGKGKFGLVYLGINKLTQEKVAIKTLCKKSMSTTDFEQVKTEVEILRIADHPNIVTLYDEYENLDYIYIIMEYCAGGDLFSFLEKRQFKLTEECASNIIRKLASAVYFLHEYGILHRDLKPENILLKEDSEQAEIKVLDFGLGKISGPNEKSIEGFGTLSYVAPEVLQDIPHGKAVDLWSIGIITYLLLSGSLPFDDEHSEKEIVRQTINDNVPYPPSIWMKISSEAKQFVDNLLNKDQEKRMIIKEVLEHPWLKKFESTTTTTTTTTTILNPETNIVPGGENGK